MFSKEFPNITLIVAVILIFYLVFAFSIGPYFLFRYIYGRLAKDFFDNSSNTNQGAFHMMLHYGLRKILIEFIHFFDDSLYLTKTSCLFCIEFTFWIFSINNVKKEKNIQHKLKGWINFKAEFLRMLLIAIISLRPPLNKKEQSLILLQSLCT
jgi:hypothetical protein